MEAKLSLVDPVKFKINLRKDREDTNLLEFVWTIWFKRHFSWKPKKNQKAFKRQNDWENEIKSKFALAHKR